MFHDFVEIGTSDFDTEIQKNDGRRGLSIEPIQYYLDRLPDNPRCTKLNLAVSDHSGTCVVNYLSNDVIRKHNFPDFVKGCNSINAYHPTVAQLCQYKGLDIAEIATSDQVEVVTLFDILKRVSGVYLLKIDTEGHDVVILSQFAKDVRHNAMWPHVIKFESNELTSPHDVTRTIEALALYDVVERGHDTTLKLNLKKLADKQHFTDAIHRYYIMSHPAHYDINNLPHANTLAAAQAYCVQHQCAGVTLQDGIYQVRDGPHMHFFEADIWSWVFV
jgi:FkbM family methyltransferase